ncbi:MAG: alpha/beta hydrolase [Anaerolineae bacterium]|nr:alpha/beta hydrolase [Anaerolineae bacterium]MCI0611054.1 alpha/beta hydrolase [Anaerolineae bacterium]
MANTHATVADHFITINGLSIHYRDWGDPQLPPLVILHGGGNSISRSWDHIAAALADRFRIIVPDLRGNGESSWAPEYSWQLILDDTLKLMDALGVSQTALCGHSLGGRVAYMLASGYPERITRLVIVEADPFDPEVRNDDSPIEIYGTIDDAVVEAYRRQPYADKNTLCHEVEHGLKLLEDGRWTWRMDPAFQTAALRGYLNPGTKLEWPALAQIRCPTVLIYGAHSLGKGGSMRKPGVAETIAQTIPNCQLIEIPDAAHDLPNENPTGFIRALRAFLAEMPGSLEPSE